MKYTVFKEWLLNEEGVRYKAYGIKAAENGKELCRISDICRTYIEARRLCAKYNRLKLDVDHLHDVAEDYVTEHSLR